MAQVISALPRLSGPQHDLSPVPYEPVSVIGLSADRIPVWRQQFLVGLGQANDIRIMQVDPSEYFWGFALTSVLPTSRSN